MSEDYTAYYESLVDLFASTGWHAFVEDMQAGADQIKLENCNSTEEFWKAKGAYEVFNRMLGYEDFIRQGFEEYENA